MASNASSALLIGSSFLPSFPSYRKTIQHNKFRGHIRDRPICESIAKASDDFRREDIVIVGGGIAGLATALSLHRLGVRSLVLEQARSLRTEGTSIGLFKNGWRVLDAIGVGSDLRSQFLELQGIVLKSQDGRELRSFKFKDEDGSQEVRSVERKVLLETLARELPPDAVRFSSKLMSIGKGEGDETFLKLADGMQLGAKIVIGCDGIRSRVARWMGFSEPRYVGYCAFRGLAFYPNRHLLEPKLNYVYGKGMRVGLIPVSPTKVYWFICFNCPSPGSRITDPLALKKQAQELLKDWPSEVLNIVDSTPDDTIIRTPLVDRWLWPSISPPAFSGQVVLVGDAWHPMTPNLGQGACCALEDAVVLARKLANAIKSDASSVEDALRSYEAERWPRVFPISIRANLVGLIFQSENPLVRSVLNNVIIPQVRLGSLLEHTNFDCERLGSV